MRGRLVVVGDALLDRDIDGRVERIAPDAPVPVVDETDRRTRPGGAGLAAVLAADDGRDVTLVTALADDDAGRELADLLVASGVTLIALSAEGTTPEKVRVRAAGGRPLLRLDRGGGTKGGFSPPPPEVPVALEATDAVLVADYGRGMTAMPALRDMIGAAAQRRPVVWDPHPRGAAPLAGVRLATPNRAEAERFVPEVPGGDLAGVAARARALALRWDAAGVAVTLGAAGAVLVDGDAHPLVVPAPSVTGGDPCGAGDRFAATAAGLLADGALVSEAVVGAVTAASEFVAAGGAAAVEVGEHTEEADDSAAADAGAVVAQTRSRGGTVVAAGGCFDLLHAGHVALLQAARALGDCLVVCVNSDSSVRRLKGAGRPLVGVDDRRALLLALGCVDAVAIFDEDTPEAVLERLQPDIWAKGADYATRDLPEEKVLERWGGQIVVLPYLEGRSTSELVGGVLRRGNG